MDKVFNWSTTLKSFVFVAYQLYRVLVYLNIDYEKKQPTREQSVALLPVEAILSVETRHANVEIAWNRHMNNAHLKY